MTSALSEYLSEQLGVFLNVKQQKCSKLKTWKQDFYAKTLLYNVIFYQILMLFKFFEYFEYHCFWMHYGINFFITNKRFAYVRVFSN